VKVDVANYKIAQYRILLKILNSNLHSVHQWHSIDCQRHIGVVTIDINV